ncbi:related to 1-(5-phosphoribosyl)-5-[(5-phosphoribosylamino)methylideneamino] imidazole-4-carboxamide isomerase [Hanseniaspora guilliermondii]|uniref:1-(5-phosphoribosyl)-5-[(5-phosphoribosylamino)methylideneamino] imidazole-4-carboxamide isomerase n=1 Tax=Hanseniaspora guilliermondii TaxID=56406 RepID=A0A1L0CMP3_9ASCO|nr:related to 1-(5-phosphoribosyl)-5-[(5-phosphoribosylamino)methylideneamino] imidazole-4-carboxamide isomerase [Hanseniaspora guilliermondii]
MTKFTGCIDIHQGQVKQIIGSTLLDDDKKINNNTIPNTNFVSDKDSTYYADLYENNNIQSTHIILLDGRVNEDTISAGERVLSRHPDFFQVGGGINASNCKEWIKKGARKIIVTSAVFNQNGEFQWDELKKIFNECGGRQRLVLDLSCKKNVDNGEWVVCMNKWTKLTNLSLSFDVFKELSQYSNEFLIHAADVEGLCKGIEYDLVKDLGEWVQKLDDDVKIVYAGGAKSIEDLKTVKELSNGRVDLTFGSSLDIFGGKLVKFDDCVRWNNSQ